MEIGTIFEKDGRRYVVITIQVNPDEMIVYLKSEESLVREQERIKTILESKFR